MILYIVNSFTTVFLYIRTRKGLEMKKFIGDKAFYKMVLLVAVPIMVQNGITNFVNLLDNTMAAEMKKGYVTRFV